MKAVLRTATRLRLFGLVVALWLSAAGPAAAGPIEQMQQARRFLLLVLQGRYPEAYAMLAPEVRSAVTPERFWQASQPLYQQGRQTGADIELYRLGLRIGEADDTRWFYAFTFKADSVAPPRWQLDVTFRDSTATGILEFRLVPTAAKP